MRSGHDGRHPVLFALDEMYGSPIPELIELLSEGGSQGLLICGALQDLSQATARWGDAGKGFLTLWQNVVVMRGIRDDSTIELLSKLIGDYDRPMTSQSEQHSRFGWGTDWMRQESIMRQRMVPPDAIYRGDQQHPNRCLIFTPNGGWTNFDTMRYFDWPWSVILIQSIAATLRGSDQEQWHLPLPVLAPGGDTRNLFAQGGQDLVDWWLEVHTSWTRKNGRLPPG
jgi:type IV secretory pathway TraG/TraD family ATPase VirD4